MENITPEVVREYKGFTDKFLCGLKANTYNIRFRKFKVRDMDSGYVLFPERRLGQQPVEPHV